MRQIEEYREQVRELNVALVRVEERERRRIAQVLHDELGQTLAALRIAVCELRDSEACKARAGSLEALRALVDHSIEVTRSLNYRLSPPILYELGLVAALQALGDILQEKHGVRFVFVLEKGWSPPARDVGVVLYRLVRELLHNVTKHARASRVRMKLDRTEDRVRITIADDGVGFDATSAETGCSQGLSQVRERMRRLGGALVVESVPGRGTRAVLSLPADSSGERRAP